MIKRSRVRYKRIMRVKSEFKYHTIVAEDGFVRMVFALLGRHKVRLAGTGYITVAQVRTAREHSAEQFRREYLCDPFVVVDEPATLTYKDLKELLAHPLRCNGTVILSSTP